MIGSTVTTTKPLPADLEPDPRKIIALFRSATSEELAEGMAWYADAHSIALALDPQSPARAAGTLAALSPRLDWLQNVKLAARTYAEGAASGTLGDNCRKANAILSGAAPEDTLSGPKVRAFYAAIADPTDSNAVVIDRHAFDIAIGHVTSDETRAVLGRKGVYERFADAYRKAARILGVAPSQVQAVTWVAWRRNHSQFRAANRRAAA